jgi:hypothetical protein
MVGSSFNSTILKACEFVMAYSQNLTVYCRILALSGNHLISQCVHACFAMYVSRTTKIVSIL